MTDRLPVHVAPNGAIRHGIYDENGLLIRYEYIKNEDGAAVLGTQLSKANLLKDTTAEKLGLTPAADPTLDEAFNTLAPFKVGNVMHTVRNDLGAKYLLCNGAKYDGISAYPELASADPTPINWAKVTSPPSVANGGHGQIAVGNGYYVMNVYTSGSYAGIAYAMSLEGPWTTTNVYGSVSTSCVFLKFVNGYFFIQVYQSGTYMTFYAADPRNVANWQSISTSGQTLQDVLWTGTHFLFLCLFSNTSINLFYATAPSIAVSNWNAYSGSAVADPIIMGIGNGLICVVFTTNSSGTIFKTCPIGSVGGAWASYTSDLGNSKYPRGLIYSGGQWLATFSINTQPYIYKTTNFTTCTLVWNLLTDYHNSNGLTFYNGYYYLAIVRTTTPYPLKIIYSSDLSTWNEHLVTAATGNSYDPNEFITNGNYIIFSQYNNPFGIFYSTVPTGNFKALPTISPTGAYAYIKAVS